MNKTLRELYLLPYEGIGWHYNNLLVYGQYFSSYNKTN